MNEQERLNALTAPLLTWYDIYKRVLPWRGIRDPYRIWVSEIMLQQTRVQAVLEYYARFMAELPDVYALAAVGEERLFKLWEGLGYYSRARNLHRAAQVLVNDCGGEFPRTREELLRLPGVGDYTASAIASIAFGEPEPAVDGNLLRVAARVGGIAEDIMDARVRKRFRAMLTESIDCERPGEWNQAMMDLGATVCLPNGAPLCEKCPARAFCAAYQNGMTDVLPVRAAKNRAGSRSGLCSCSCGTAGSPCASVPPRGCSRGCGSFRMSPGILTRPGRPSRSRNGGLRRGRSRRSVQQSIFFPMWNGICTAILPRQRARTMNFSGRTARRCKRRRSPRHSDTTSTRRSDGSPHNREDPIMAQLYFKYGAMGSSKTANALMARFNYEERGQQTLLVKPQLDTRDGDHMVHSRIGLEFPCVYFHEMREMSEDELKKNACIIVDEAQFLTREEVMYLVHLVDDCGIPVMCYGLRADFRGELFPGSYELLVMADKLEEVKTICWCGKKAAFNARFDANGKVLKEGEQVVLGANDQYIGLCRRHWMAGDLGPDFNGQGTGD